MSVVGKSLAGMIRRVERSSTVGVEAQFVAASSVVVKNIAASARINMLQRVSPMAIRRCAGARTFSRRSTLDIVTPSALDWSIVIAFVAVLIGTALYANRLARGVSGFLSADRCAGRYLVTVAYNMAQVGVITLVWYFQLGYDVGYTQIWWGYFEGPSLIL